MIPTHREIIRDDRNDLIYKTKREKYSAVIDEIADCFKIGQPTLVGTIAVDSSELLSRMLKQRGIPHNVLNAKQHKGEAEIVARTLILLPLNVLPKSIAKVLPVGEPPRV